MWAFGIGSGGDAAALYLACAVVFVVLGGLALYPDVRGRVGLLRFCLIFGVAFLAFAVLWCGVYFAFRGKHGEVLGFLPAVAAMCIILQLPFEKRTPLIPAIGVAFTCHIAAYLLGDYLFYGVLLPGGAPVPGKLAWGFCHGFGFGAGLGWMFQSAGIQR